MKLLSRFTFRMIKILETDEAYDAQRLTQIFWLSDTFFVHMSKSVARNAA